MGTTLQAEDIAEIAGKMGIGLSPEGATEWLSMLAPFLAQIDEIAATQEPAEPLKYPRKAGRRPTDQEDPNNAWYHKAEIKGAMQGPLKGRTVGLKDNIFVAGLPMINGGGLPEGFTPEVDATIVTRLLDAGADIIGKTQCEYFCVSGSSHTNITGPCHNPHRRGYSAGGSSSGSAAALAANEVDLAIGTDQAGSIRMPASFCGVVGMKPSIGLVPYTGILGLEGLVDHVGPMTRTVSDNALLLEVLAGPDGLDCRQPAGYVPPKYTEALEMGVKGLRIAVVREGFGRAESQAAVDAKVINAANTLSRLGASVQQVSLPLHNEAGGYFINMLAEGMTREGFDGNGLIVGASGAFSIDYIKAFRNWRSRADSFPVTAQAMMILGRYVADRYGGEIWLKCAQRVQTLRTRFARAMRDYDILLMPTTPMTAPKLPTQNASRTENLQKAWEMLGNTAPYCATGMPSLSIPCGLVDGMPIGMMLTGRMFEESTLYRAAHAFEQDADWRSL